MALAAQVGANVNVLQDTAGAAGALDVGFVPSAAALASKAAPEVVVLLGSDDYPSEWVPDSAKVIYLGSHGERGAARADVVLPGAAYTEKSATWVNTEGRAQRSKAVVALPGEAREDWEVVRAVSELAGVTLPYDSVAEVRQRMFDIAPHLVRAGAREAPLFMVGEAINLAKGGAATAEALR